MGEKGKGIAVLKGYVYAKRMLDSYRIQTCATGRNPYFGSEKVEGGTRLYFVKHEPKSRRVKRGYGGKRTYHNTPEGTVKRYCVEPASRHANRVHGQIPESWSGPVDDFSLLSEREQMCLHLVRKVNGIMAEWDEDEREVVTRKYLVERAPVADRTVHKSLRDDGYKMTMGIYQNKLAGCLVALADHFNDLRGDETFDQSYQEMLN